MGHFGSFRVLVQPPEYSSKVYSYNKMFYRSLQWPSVDVFNKAIITSIHHLYIIFVKNRRKSSL